MVAAVRVEDLNAMIASVGHVDAPAGVHGEIALWSGPVFAEVRVIIPEDAGLTCGPLLNARCVQFDQPVAAVLRHIHAPISSDGYAPRCIQPSGVWYVGDPTYPLENAQRSPGRVVFADRAVDPVTDVQVSG